MANDKRVLVPGISGLFGALIKGQFTLADMDSALFCWIDPVAPREKHAGWAEVAFVLKTNAELYDAAIAKLRVAQSEGRLANETSHGTSQLDAMLVRHGLEPVETSDFVYFIFPDGEESSLDENGINANYRWDPEGFSFAFIF